MHRISSTFAVPGGVHMYDDYEGKRERMLVPLWGGVTITRMGQGHTGTMCETGCVGNHVS